MKEQKEFEIVRHTMMNDLEIFLVEMTARSPHGHDDLEIGLVLEGNMTLFLEQEELDLKKGDIYLINRYQVHSFLNAKDRNLILAFQVHTGFYRRINYQLTFLRFNNNIIRNGHLYTLLFEKLQSCARMYFGNHPFREIECCSILLHALYLLLENVPYTVSSEREYHMAQNSSLRINRITEYIADHYQEHITLEDVAELEHITTYHASHFIKKMFGISFQEYLNNIRFEHALRLLSQTNLSLLDICMESGFSSSRYLNQMFEKNFDCTAKEYKKKMQKPVLKGTALPVSNIQKRYSFERSALLFNPKN